MSEVTRTCRCPECSLLFYIKFDSGHRLGGTLVRVGCPRCEGFIRTHVPADYRVVPTESRSKAPAVSPKNLST